MNYTYSNGSSVRRNRNRARTFGSAYAAAHTKPYEEPGPGRSEPAEESALGTAVAEAQTVTEAAEEQTVTEAAEKQTVTAAAQARTVTVSLPGGAALIPLALGQPHMGVTYNTDTAETVITEAGGYMLKFSLAIDSPIDTKCAITVRANGRKLPGGVFGISLKKGRQSWSESLEAALSMGDAIGLAFNSASPLSVKITGDDTLPELVIEKITG